MQVVPSFVEIFTLVVAVVGVLVVWKQLAVQTAGTIITLCKTKA
jgi:hypothetical protein